MANSVLIEKHQRKGLHLIHSADEYQSKEKYDHYRIRDRVMWYLSKYSSQKVFGEIQEKEQKN